ncbi:MAG: hypothetical protein INF92_16450 [Rhodobacter sp.]|jgi:hypothetical protein|nr:hypothetical protein [Rhodobacter sp.]
MALRTSMPLSATGSMPGVGGLIGNGRFRNHGRAVTGRAMAHRNAGMNGGNAGARRVPSTAVRQVLTPGVSDLRPVTDWTDSGTARQRASGAACLAALPGTGPVQ